MWTRLYPVFVLAGGLLTQSVAAGPPADPPGDFLNLQVLPIDLSQNELDLLMSAWASALGVDCSHCHIAEGDWATWDLSADDKPTKDVARQMWLLTGQINQKLGVDAGQEGLVECVTCHRGQAKPSTLTSVLRQALQDEGIDGATARYRELRELYFGRGGYDFGENSLLDLAGDLSRRGDDPAAIALLRLNVEFHPESAFTRAQLGSALRRIGALSEATQRFDEAMRLAPGNDWIRSMATQAPSTGN